ncbi:ABC transporter permease, partial [Gemmatimonadota bacterium]
RDSRSLMIIFAMPVVMTFLYGYAMNFDLKDIPLGVVDEDGTPASRELTESFVASGQFELAERYRNMDEAEAGFAYRESVITLVIPRGFSRSLDGGPGRQVGLLVDGSDPNTASIALGYARGIISRVIVEGSLNALSAMRDGSGSVVGWEGLPIELHPRFWYNPEQKSSHFIVPALIAVILMMASALLTSVTVVREKESGTLEQLLVSPVRPVELIVGKVLPYGVLAMADGAFILFFGAMVFGVPIRGSLLVLFGFTGLYIMAALTIGLVISTIVNQQRVAMFGAMLVTVMPAFMLSNFIFPVKSMPVFLQWVSKAIPATYYIPIVRGVLLKGVGVDVFWQNGLFLICLTVVLTVISVIRFKPRLD